MGTFATLYQDAELTDFYRSAIAPLADPISPEFAREWQQSTLARLQAPALIMWGDRDTYAPREQQDRLLAAIPGARLVRYAGGGHGFHWEDPTTVAADLLAFLSTIAGRGVSVGAGAH